MISAHVYLAEVPLLGLRGAGCWRIARSRASMRSRQFGRTPSKNFINVRREL